MNRRGNVYVWIAAGLYLLVGLIVAIVEVVALVITSNVSGLPPPSIWAIIPRFILTTIFWPLKLIANAVGWYV